MLTKSEAQKLLGIYQFVLLEISKRDNLKEVIEIVKNNGVEVGICYAVEFHFGKDIYADMIGVILGKFPYWSLEISEISDALQRRIDWLTEFIKTGKI